MARSALLGNSLVKKYWMALTGLFLVSFLAMHLAGNLQLLDGSPNGRENFNQYADFMTTFPVVKVVSYLLYFSILFHSFDGLLLALQNRKARGRQRYAYENSGANSHWYARRMALLGTLILAFIVLHMGNFWYKYHWGDIPMVEHESGKAYKDLYSVVEASFQRSWYVAIYLVSMAILAFHLLHGFQSAFQSLGINHGRYTPWIRNFGVFFAVVVPIFFALIPVWMFFNAHQ